MKWLDRLFHHEKPEPGASLKGVAPAETQASQDEMRAHMEAEVAADREKRGATKVAPGA